MFIEWLFLHVLVYFISFLLFVCLFVFSVITSSEEVSNSSCFFELLVSIFNPQKKNILKACFFIIPDKSRPCILV